MASKTKEREEARIRTKRMREETVGSIVARSEDEATRAWEMLRDATAQWQGEHSGKGREGRVALLQRATPPARAIVDVLASVAKGVPLWCALEGAGVSPTEMSLARMKSQAVAMMLEQAKRMEDDVIGMKARAAMSSLLTDPESKYNPKAVTYALEKCGGGAFERKSESGADSGGGVVYNIIINAPQGGESCEKIARQQGQDAVIDV